MSRHPFLSAVDVPGTEGHASPFVPEGLSPNPSRSESACCEASFGRISAPSAMVQIGPFVPNKSSSEVPSLSESGHPKRSVTEVPATVGHWSGLFPVGSSPNPSPSASSHCVESFGNASSPSANPSLSRSEQPRLPNSVDVPKVVGPVSYTHLRAHET